MNNRSVPVNTLLPHIAYQNVAAAIAWLTDRFGFVEHFRYGDPAAPSGAQMHRGKAWIVLSSAREGRSSPAQLSAWTQSLTIFLDDVAAHYSRTQAKGIRIVEELHETVYGELQYATEDLEGHHWIFSQHARDLSPEDWGATLAAR